MRFTDRFAIAALALATITAAQSNRPQLEVASVKPCKDGEPPPGAGRKGARGGRVTATPGRLVAECATLRTLIRSAYILFPNGERVEFVPPRVIQQDIKGSPSWMDSDRFNIEAKAEGPASPDLMRGPMLQALLEARFHLTIRREPRETSVFELTLAKGGPRFPVAKSGSCVTFDRDHPPPERSPGPPKICGMFSGEYIYGTTMTTFCRQLTSLLDRDVIDKTGLTGHYDVHLFGLSDIVPGSPDSEPGQTSFAASLEAVIPRLGLRLEPAKATAEFLVIDHVEKPAGN